MCPVEPVAAALRRVRCVRRVSAPVGPSVVAPGRAFPTTGTYPQRPTGNCRAWQPRRTAEQHGSWSDLRFPAEHSPGIGLDQFSCFILLAALNRRAGILETAELGQSASGYTLTSPLVHRPKPQ